MLSALLVSALFHTLILMIPFSQTMGKLESEQRPIEIEVLREPLKVIAPPSEAEKREPSPKVAIMLSSEDRQTLDPQIRRGQEPVTSVKAPPKKASTPRPQENPPKPQETSIPSEVKLKLDPLDISRIAKNRETKVSEKPQKQTKTLSDYQPFMRNSANARIGSPDLLPNIRDGEITLLNTKADTYAVFVRRVALKVFSELRHKSWSELSYHMARSSSKFSTVRATMDSEGKLLRIQLIDSSSNSAFDSLLETSARTGTWDHNPPKGAQASDGKIHFIFKSKTWAERYGDRNIERRWLLLATGLE